MKIKFLLYCSLLFAGAALYTGCYYDKASLVYPNGSDCDTTGIQLSTDLNSIMQTSCFSCHGAANASSFGGGYNLENYNTVKSLATSGTLMSAITQDGNASPMPQGGSKLSDCNINKFSAWINSGTPNN